MVADKNVKELEGSRAELTITIDSASIEKDYSEKLAKYAKEVQIDGFRKGKVPVSVLERKFGDAIREESTFKTMEEGLEEALKDIPEDQKPIAFSTPELQNEESLLPFKKGEDITFSVIYDIYPKFDLPQYTGLTAEVPAVEITDKDIDDKIEELRDRNAIVRTKDGKAADGDIVTIDYVEIDADGNEIASTKRDGFTFTLGSGYNFYKVDEDVKGMKAGDEKTVEKSYTEEDNIPGYAGKTIKLSIKLTALKERELPAVDDDLAQDIKDEYKTVADLRNGIKEKFQKEVDDAVSREKEDAIMKKLVSETEFPVPESMVKAELDNRWRGFLRQTGMTQEQIEKFMSMQDATQESIMNEWRPEVVEMLKTQLIMEKIREKEDFQISDEELNEACEKRLQNVPESEKDSYKEMIKEEMQFGKVLPFLLEKNTFKTGDKKSYSEYMGR